MKSQGKTDVVKGLSIWSMILAAAARCKDGITRAAFLTQFQADEMKGKAERTFGSFGDQIRFMMTGLFLMMAGACPVFAAPSASDVFSGLLGIICAMCQYIGMALAVWGVVQFVLAVKRTDAESKSDAMQTIVCGIALIGAKALITALGFGTPKDVTL